MKAIPLSSGEGEPVWLDPAAVEFTISPSADLSGVVGGDWDVERRYPLARSVKHRAIFERYREGRRWEDTDLFRDVYARRLEHQQVRGVDTFEELVAQYYGRVDAMFDDLRTSGFRINDEKGRPLPLPGLLIGRGGDVFLDNQGNHRVAMAKVIGLERMAGRMRCWHEKAPPWTECRTSRP